MTGLQIKVEGEWLALPDDFSISFEDQSPVFNDQGAFSFPFEIPIEPNRIVLRNIADAFGAITLADIDKMDAEMWFDDVLIYRGLLETDDSVDIEDSISVSFVSGNSSFEDAIEDLELRDLPLDRDIHLGHVCTQLDIKSKGYDYISVPSFELSVPMPQYALMSFTECNISKPYPQATFCNARICCSNGEGGYKILGAYRSESGVCFYVMYMLDLLFKHIGVSVLENHLYDVEDMTRLAFFTTVCDYELRDEQVIPVTPNFAPPVVQGDTMPYSESYCFHLEGEFKTSRVYDNRIVEETGVNDCTKYMHVSQAYATSQNFPDESVSDVIDDLKNAFGVRFLYYNKTNQISIYFIKDILADNEVKSLDVEVLDYTVNRTKFTGNLITYGQDDDTNFNYSDFSNVKEYSGYQAILDAGVHSADTVCKYDALTGNFYRVKVNKDTGGDPALFEVGGYNSWGVEGTSKEDQEEISIGFVPVTLNDVQKAMTGGTSITENQCLAVYVDEELAATYEFTYAFATDWTDCGDSRYRSMVSGNVIVSYPGAFDTENSNESPLASYDAGYSLGIMRGPGSDSHIEYTNNYDGEGNDKWVQTSANYAFTADSCDNFGKFFDYNGSEEGGIDQSGRISLKIVATKDGYGADTKYANRGLADKFMGEYMHFQAKKKVVTLSVDMSLMQIINIDYTKRYKIGDFVGWINKITYELHLDGISDVKIELYTI